MALSIMTLDAYAHFCRLPQLLSCVIFLSVIMLIVAAPIEQWNNKKFGQNVCFLSQQNTIDKRKNICQCITTFAMYTLFLPEHTMAEAVFR
jgi:hypothetical protein